MANGWIQRAEGGTVEIGGLTTWQALEIIRGLWTSSGDPYSHEGDILSVHDVRRTMGACRRPTRTAPSS